MIESGSFPDILSDMFARSLLLRYFYIYIKTLNNYILKFIKANILTFLREFLNFWHYN